MKSTLGHQWYYRSILFYLLLISQSIFSQKNTIATSTNLKSLKINQIQFSKDSTFINAFDINNEVYKLAVPIALFSNEKNTKKEINQQILSVSESHDGWLIKVRLSNNGLDTITLKNILPFEKNSHQAYITGKGDHRLSRTHLFLPGKQPINVIVPDNAWELGYNSILLNNNLSVYGFSRRTSESLIKGKQKRFETILYPNGNIEFDIWIEPYLGAWQNGVIKVFKERKLYDVEKFNDSLYNRQDLQWMRHTYLMHLMMSWDKYFYDRKANQYALNKFIERGNQSAIQCRF